VAGGDALSFSLKGSLTYRVAAVRHVLTNFPPPLLRATHFSLALSARLPSVAALIFERLTPAEKDSLRFETPITFFDAPALHLRKQPPPPHSKASLPRAAPPREKQTPPLPRPWHPQGVVAAWFGLAAPLAAMAAASETPPPPSAYAAAVQSGSLATLAALFPRGSPRLRAEIPFVPLRDLPTVDPSGIVVSPPSDLARIDSSTEDLEVRGIDVDGEFARVVALTEALPKMAPQRAADLFSSQIEAKGSEGKVGSGGKTEEKEVVEFLRGVVSLVGLPAARAAALRWGGGGVGAFVDGLCETCAMDKHPLFVSASAAVSYATISPRHRVMAKDNDAFKLSLDSNINPLHLTRALAALQKGNPPATQPIP
jgi:hypothetical protein